MHLVWSDHYIRILNCSKFEFKIIKFYANNKTHINENVRN